MKFAVFMINCMKNLQCLSLIVFGKEHISTEINSYPVTNRKQKQKLIQTHK